VTVLFLSSACVHETHQGVKNTELHCEATQTAIRATIQRLISADNARDLPTVMSSYSADVMFLPPAGEEVIGREAVEARYRNLFATYAPLIQMQVAEIHLGDEWAFVRGTTQGTLTGVDTGEVTTLDDKFIALLRCDRNAWKISRLIWHHAQPNKPR
jgi:uncharacterized protein (TIGR02246 family)